MTVKIDGVEPSIFPDVDDLDARDAGRNVELFLDVRVEDKPTCHCQAELRTSV